MLAGLKSERVSEGEEKSAGSSEGVCKLAILVNALKVMVFTQFCPGLQCSPVCANVASSLQQSMPSSIDCVMSAGADEFDVNESGSAKRWSLTDRSMGQGSECACARVMPWSGIVKQSNHNRRVRMPPSIVGVGQRHKDEVEIGELSAEPPRFRLNI